MTDAVGQTLRYGVRVGDAVCVGVTDDVVVRGAVDVTVAEADAEDDAV